MVEVEKQKISSIYDYVSSDSGVLRKANGAFVFGRADPLVASRTAELYADGLVDYCLMSGGLGKDSGVLIGLEFPEAFYQAGLLRWTHKVPDKNIFVESKSRNGAECCTFGMETILENDLPYNNLIIVVHSTSLRRTEAVMHVKATEKNFMANYQRTGTKYSFNAENLVDQKESVAELLRIADWPAKGWAVPQNDLPIELVDYARLLDSKWKNEIK